MSEDRSEQGPRQSFGPGEGPKLLGQMLASGAEAEFTVDRGLKRDLRLPSISVGEVVGSDRISLEFPADEAEDASWSGADSAGKADDFSESPICEGLGEILKAATADAAVIRSGKADSCGVIIAFSA